MRLTYRLCFTRREPLSKTPGDSTWEGCHWGSQTRMLYETPTQSEHFVKAGEAQIINTLYYEPLPTYTLVPVLRFRFCSAIDVFIPLPSILR